MRLGGFLFYNRILKPLVDPRYIELAEKRQENKTFYYLFQFQLQGFLTVFTSIPLYFLFQKTNWQLYNWARLGIALIGIFGEAIADQQLQNHKNTRTDSSEVFREGLFKNARHPNLFFDLLTWYGFALIGFNHVSLCTLFAFTGPVILNIIMNYITIPITIKYMMKTKPNYKQVIAETNKYLPFRI